MTWLIVALGAVCLGMLIWEDRQVRSDRKKLKHVVYVNGIRGKSTVTRLIDAGLRAGGWRVFCKTTGTDPMVIGVDNVQRPLIRHGRANIKEQIKILHRAVKENAEVLVIECMAVDPALQAVSQHRMVYADVGVITNVRLDHTAEMGPTLEDICDSLSNTIPKGGVLYTADQRFVPRMRKRGQELGCRVELAVPDEELPAIDFPENRWRAAPHPAQPAQHGTPVPALVSSFWGQTADLPYTELRLSGWCWTRSHRYPPVWAPSRRYGPAAHW